ncbi:MAG: glycoside hydrolase [Chloroflexi bacterium]|nr:glycoside hydrolase [Chloroflexota bacterium]
MKGGRWSEPYRLSSEAGKASEGYLVADQFGYVHCFWTETLFEDPYTIIQYARFDGETWSIPNDIYVIGADINTISPVVDRQGTLHIAWTQGLNGPAYYTYAPATDALSARNWAPPLQVDIPANNLRLRVDSKGVIHILYINRMEESGVYYVRSEDQGATWSEPAWLDPDILPNHIPDSLSFELDEAGGLHAVWFYGALDQTSRADWVRYTHSFDGGHTWSVPFMIDQYAQESEHNLTVASPIMMVQGQTVHVIWAAGSLPYRNHRISLDAGRTWSAPRQIFGELHGQAFDGFAVDGAGRVHFFGQIRYPVGIYHASWDQTQWTPPSLIYLIAQEGEEIGDRIHAHHTHPAVRAGEQLVLTFADGPADPNRRLFAMHRILDDPSSLETLPKSAPTATPISVPSPTAERPTPMPTLTATAPFFDAAAAQPLGPAPRLDLALWVALVPTLLLLGGTVVIRLLYKLKP